MLRKTLYLMAAAGSGPFDPYKILGVKPNASKKEIRDAYHKLALRFHPDSGPEGNAERFNAVHEAYEALKSGKWKPMQTPGGSGPDGNFNGGRGYDPKMHAYVYEEPGSTTENYVRGDTEKLLWVVLILSFSFVIFRMVLFAPKPRKPMSVGGEPTVESFSAPSSPSSTHFDGTAHPTSIHDDQEDFAHVNMYHSPVDDRPANYVIDPLSKR